MSSQYYSWCVASRRKCQLTVNACAYTRYALYLCTSLALDTFCSASLGITFSGSEFLITLIYFVTLSSSDHLSPGSLLTFLPSPHVSVTAMSQGVGSFRPKPVPERQMTHNSTGSSSDVVWPGWRYWERGRVFKHYLDTDCCWSISLFIEHINLQSKYNLAKQPDTSGQINIVCISRIHLTFTKRLPSVHLGLQ